ncbi:hypothetical protein [Pseudomonas putida]|uniref:Uncharacterized protein n=1 Tax=Pseudomonas putida TaxID=303 RepID=A0A8I1JGH8_PSEPU|nr:hypothetical protein [Pseudomonas putida]MBI6882832.1 hypothetical protein [Pseudomonas putida]
MSFFKNTSDAEARKILGSRLDRYIEESSVDYKADGTLLNSTQFGNLRSQLFTDIGHARFSAYNPNLAAIYLFLKDGEAQCHNNWTKPEVMNCSLGSEYLDVIGFYGLTTMNPSLAVPEGGLKQALANVIARPFSLFFESAEGQLLNPPYASEVTIREDINRNQSEFSRYATYLYLLAMCSGFEPSIDSRALYLPSLEPLYALLGIDDGKFTLESISTSNLTLRNLLSEPSELSPSCHRQLALALCLLPGHSLMIDRFDPEAVKSVMCERAFLALGGLHADNEAATRAEAEAIANLVFCPFPELWKPYGIDQDRFLGKDIAELQDYSEEETLQSVGLFFEQYTKMETAKILTVLHENLEFVGSEIGSSALGRPATIGDMLKGDLSKAECERVLNDLLSSSKLDFSRPLFTRIGLNTIDEKLLGQCFAKTLANETYGVFRMMGQQISHDYLVSRTCSVSPRVVEEAFRYLVENENFQAVSSLMKYRQLPSEHLLNVPRSIRGEAIQNDLGI